MLAHDVHIENDIATIKYTADGGRQVTKSVQAREFAKAVLKAQPETLSDDIKFFQPFLRLKAIRNNQIMCLYEYPERVNKIVYIPNGAVREHGKIETHAIIPWSAIFVQATLSGGRYAVNNAWAFATLGTIRNLDEMLYRWPGTNVWNDHHICFGHVSFPQIDTEDKLGTIPPLFFNSICNDDLDHERFTPFPNPVSGDLVDRGKQLFFEYLAFNPETQPPVRFPYSCMIRATTIKTFLQEKGF